MFDADSIKHNTDLLAVIGRDTQLKHVASTHGGEYAGPCPLCRDGTDRLRVWPNHPDGFGRWWCRQCEKGGDVIAYVMQRDNLGFREACERLGGSALDTTTTERQKLTPAQPVRPAGPPPVEWQRNARAVVLACVNNLWSDTGSRARDYLHARGLTDNTLKHDSIGYLPGGPKEWRDVAGLSVPCGIVIPCEIEGVIWYVKVRRASGEPKYIQVKDSRPALYGADSLLGRHDVAVICEGEFDSMLLQQEIGDLAGVCTMGSVSGADIDLEQWGRYLLPIRTLLIATDADEAGRKAAERLLALTARAHAARLPLPGVKDITDFWKAGSNLRAWIAFELERIGAQQGNQEIDQPIDPATYAAQMVATGADFTTDAMVTLTGADAAGAWRAWGQR